MSADAPANHSSIALLGHGTVGRGVVRLLSEMADAFRQRAGITFDVRHVVVRDASRHTGELPFTVDAESAIADPEIGIVVELIGGTTRARELVLQALKCGKHVVTANKALIAAHGPELFATARKNGVSLALEASCGGGIPIIGALTGGLLANRVEALVGILNGTSNVILTAMSEAGESYEAALRQAQEQGFAEADPTLDVSGRDAAQKLAILAGLAMGVRLDESAVYVEGIDTIDPLDIAFARDLGYVVKLLATARRQSDGRIGLSVYPGLLPAGDPMADVKGPFNAVSAYGHALGHATFVGRGAGKMPTASAVVADLVQVALGTYPLAFSKLRLFPDTATPAEVLPFEETSHRYYLRLTARDVPGVLAGVTRCLGDAGISVSAILQREGGSGDHVPVVVTTHLTRESAVRTAVSAIARLGGIGADPIVLRIADMPQETIE